MDGGSPNEYLRAVILGAVYVCVCGGVKLALWKTHQQFQWRVIQFVYCGLVVVLEFACLWILLSPQIDETDKVWGLEFGEIVVFGVLACVTEIVLDLVFEVMRRHGDGQERAGLKLAEEMVHRRRYSSILEVHKVKMALKMKDAERFFQPLDDDTLYVPDGEVAGLPDGYLNSAAIANGVGGGFGGGFGGHIDLPGGRLHGGFGGGVHFGDSRKSSNASTVVESGDKWRDQLADEFVKFAPLHGVLSIPEQVAQFSHSLHDSLAHYKHRVGLISLWRADSLCLTILESSLALFISFPHPGPHHLIGLALLAANRCIRTQIWRALLVRTAETDQCVWYDSTDNNNVGEMVTGHRFTKNFHLCLSCATISLLVDLFIVITVAFYTNH